MGEYTRLPPSGIHPIDEYSPSLCVCRRDDQKSVIVYVQLYKPEDDEDYEDPEESVFAWQRQEEPMEQLNWMKKVYSVIHESEPIDHPNVQSLIQIQQGTGFPVLELIPKGNLYQFFERNPSPRVPSGQGSENQWTLQLRWALNVASALAFLHSKDLVYDSLGPSTVCLRDDLSAVLTQLYGCAYKENHGHVGIEEGYYAPGRPSVQQVQRPETWIKPSQDIFAFGSFLYYLVKGENPPFLHSVKLDYPSVEGLIGGAIVSKCWKMEYETMREVLQDLKRLIVEQSLTIKDDDIVVDESVAQLQGYSYWVEMADYREQ